jgi:anti-anti-sigma factor
VDNPPLCPWLAVAHQGVVTVVRFRGPDVVGRADIEAVGRHLGQILESSAGHRFVLNLAAVEGMTSLMVAQLIEFNRKVEEADGRLALCSLSQEVTRMLEWTGLAKFFRIYASEQEAVQAVAG